MKTAGRIVMAWVMMVVMAGSAMAEVVALQLGGAPVVRELAYDAGRAELASGGDRIVGVDIALKQLTLTPLAAGRTTLAVYDTAGKTRDQFDVTVSSGKVMTDADPEKAVKALLVDDEGRPIPTLQVERVPGSDKVRILGKVGLQRDLDRVKKAKELFADQVVDLTQMDPVYFEKLAQEIKEKISNPNIDVSQAGNVMFLSGMAFSPEEKMQVEAMVRALYPQMQSFLTIRPTAMEDVILQKPLIQVECQILEIKNDAAKQIGIDWGGVIPVSVGAGYSVANPGAPSSYISLDTKTLVKALIPQIQSGDAKVLYTQNLVCENGEQAKFFAGGSFYIVAYLGNAQDITTKEVEYGVGMDLSPKADKVGNIETTVNIEFSNIGPEINKYPSLLKRYVKTSVNVKHGQTLSLGALLGSEMRKNITKIPALGDIPVLGELFKSTNYQENKSEMVIFITPRIVVPGGAENSGLRERVQAKLAAPENK